MATVKEKLESEKERYLKNVPNEAKEMAIMQIKLVFDGIEEMAEHNECLADAILQEHKNFERCYAFMEKKARNMAMKGAKSCVVDSNLLFDWISEYYLFDDKAEVEAEEKKKSEAKAKSEAARVKNAAKTKTVIPTSMPQKEAGNPEKVGVTEESATVIKEGKKDVTGQMDLFSMFS